MEGNGIATTQETGVGETKPASDTGNAIDAVGGESNETTTSTSEGSGGQAQGQPIKY